MVEQLLQWDYRIYEWVQLHGNAFFDYVIPFLRNPFFWGPVYLFLFIFTYERYGKSGLWWCVGLLLTFGLADFVSASVLKPFFHRTRPCNDGLWYGIYRDLVPRSKGYSFPSTHASNHFGMSTYIIITLGHLSTKVKFWAILWAALVGFSQLYVGVHYPLDIVGGIFFGLWVGYVIGNYFKHHTVEHA